MQATNSKFQQLVKNPLLFRIYLLKELPLGFIVGLRVKQLDNQHCQTAIKFKWITKNPFRSMYFACQAMAAEMSTGILVMNEIYGKKPAVSMLVIRNQATFHKKAVGKITFTCSDGPLVAETIRKAKETNEAYILDLSSVGTDEGGEKVAEFIFTWSIKAKK
jgi:hypothetical protein